MPYPDGTEEDGEIPIAAQLFDRGGAFFNVMHPDFGAEGDGVNDDGIAINLAIQACPSVGGTVIIPPGSYLLTTAVTFAAKTNVTILILSGVTLTGTMPTPTGTNQIRDWRSGQALVLQQGSAADPAYILRAKNSQVAHGFTSFGETDDFFNIKPYAAAYGGVSLVAIGEDTASLAAVFELAAFGGQAAATKLVTTKGLMDFLVAEHDGAGNLANITADGACYSWRARVGGANSTLMILDEDADLHLFGNLTVVGAAGVSLLTFGGPTFDAPASDTARLTAPKVQIQGAAIGLYSVTPVAQQSHIADPGGGATIDSEARAAINAILVRIENIGIVATS